MVRLSMPAAFVGGFAVVYMLLMGSNTSKTETIHNRPRNPVAHPLREHPGQVANKRSREVVASELHEQITSIAQLGQSAMLQEVKQIVKDNTGQALNLIDRLNYVKVNSYAELDVRSRLMSALLVTLSPTELESLWAKSLKDPTLLPVQLELVKGVGLTLLPFSFWADKFSKIRPELQPVLTKAIIRNLSAFNSTEIGTFVEKIEDNAARDNLLRSLARSTQSSNLPNSFGWVNQITSPSTRQTLLAELAASSSRGQDSGNLIKAIDLLEDKADRDFLQDAIHYYATNPSNTPTKSN